MQKDIVIKNNGPKYSQMLIQIIEEFDNELPEELTFEETIEAGISAWNLANNKEFLISRNLYQKELTGHKNHLVIEKMVNYKIEKFPNFNNIIVDYSTENDMLQIKSQAPQNHFESIIKQMVNIKP